MTPVFKESLAALFYKPEYLTGGSIDVPSLMKEQFGAGLTIKILPIPFDAPPEIPRYQMSSESLTFRFSNLRADISKNDKELTDDDLNKFYNAVLGFKSQIVRAGYVLKRSYEDISEENARKNLRLQEEYISDLSEIAEASWRINRIQKIGDGDCNNISILALQPVTTERTDLLLERDVNTKQDREDLNITERPQLTKLLNSLRKEARSQFGITDNTD